MVMFFKVKMIKFQQIEMNRSEIIVNDSTQKEKKFPCVEFPTKSCESGGG